MRTTAPAAVIASNPVCTKSRNEQLACSNIPPQANRALQRNIRLDFIPPTPGNWSPTLRPWASGPRRPDPRARSRQCSVPALSGKCGARTHGVLSFPRPNCPYQTEKPGWASNGEQPWTGRRMNVASPHARLGGLDVKNRRTGQPSAVPVPITLGRAWGRVVDSL